MKTGDHINLFSVDMACPFRTGSLVDGQVLRWQDLNLKAALNTSINSNSIQLGCFDSLIEPVGRITSK